MSVCIMYAGRGDFSITDFLEQYGEMQDTFDSPVRAAGQTMDKMPLSDYLEAGPRLLAVAADGCPLGALRASVTSTYAP